MTQYTKAKFDEMMSNKIAPKVNDTVKYPDGSIAEVVYVQEGTHYNITQWKTKSEALLAQEQEMAQQQLANEILRKKNEDIDALKKQLSSTDYKIIKCYEYSLAGLELPCDIQALHTERQTLRQSINALEA